MGGGLQKGGGGAAISSISLQWAENRLKRFPWLVYTNAAAHHRNQRFLLFDGSANRTITRGQCAADASPEWRRLFRRAAVIFGLELLSRVAIVEELPPRLPAQCVWFYIDNNNVLEDIAKGDPNTDIIAILLVRLWAGIQRYSLFSWRIRVRPSVNPADLPTRGGGPPSSYE